MTVWWWRLPACAAILTATLLAGANITFASGWPVQLGSSSSAEGHAQAGPAAPTGAAATCTSATAATVTLTWNAVTLASSYDIYESTASASSGYSLAATGVTGTSWTSGSLALGNYWFEVAALTGSNWQSANSAATSETTIISPLACVQP